jgi:ATP-dependent metalloprotease
MMLNRTLWNRVSVTSFDKRTVNLQRKYNVPNGSRKISSKTSLTRNFQISSPLLQNKKLPSNPFFGAFTAAYPLTFYSQGDNLFASSSWISLQKRLFWKKGSPVQHLENQLNSQPDNTVLFLHLLRELNRLGQEARVKSLVESGRYSLSDDQILTEYLKAAAKLNALDQISVKELINAQARSSSFFQQHGIPNPSFQNSSWNNNYSGGNQQYYSNSSPLVSPSVKFTQDGQPLEVKIQRGKMETFGTWLYLALSLGLLGLLVYTWNFPQARDEKKQASSNFPISPAHSQVKNINVRFADVKGCDEVKQELVEVVEYLKNPSKFTQLGAKLPKGILLSGPPGTGKTLLARAIAGEAGVNFLYCSGSSFDELFVGVGPRRVRTLFEDAKKQAPCIIFIDEVDSVGARRSKMSLTASKESTLNQLLTEMDGFNPTSGIIVIGATNFPEALDSALIRPGRFDKIIHVPLPDLKGRKDIIDLYLKKTIPGPDVDSKVLARGTPGFSGAELANLINIAAIKATIQNKPHIDMHVLEEAKDDVLMGIKRTFEQTEEDRRLTAYHEGGHALVALHAEGAKPLHKATIISRGGALGVTVQLPERDEVSASRKQMLARLAVCMGGRAAEELIFGESEVTSGASSDLKSATALATQMIAHWGMSDKIGKVYHTLSENSPLSQDEMKIINDEIRGLLDERYHFARDILKNHEDELHRIADALMKYESLTGEEIRMVASGKRLNRDL